MYGIFEVVFYVGFVCYVMCCMVLGFLYGFSVDL